MSFALLDDADLGRVTTCAQCKKYSVSMFDVNCNAFTAKNGSLAWKCPDPECGKACYVSTLHERSKPVKPKVYDIFVGKPKREVRPPASRGGVSQLANRMSRMALETKQFGGSNVVPKVAKALKDEKGSVTGKRLSLSALNVANVVQRSDAGLFCFLLFG